MNALEPLFARLARSTFRSRFRLGIKERQYCWDKGAEVIDKHAADFIAQRLAPAHPANDGKQTPMRGHPVFIAQHATATCCRGCLAKFMIVRPQQHWIRLIFVWHGSVLSKIFSRLLLNFLLSIAVIIMLPWYTMLGIKFTLAPFSILGVAIAIFLGFRNNACYARYVEARHLWGQLMIASRSILREVKTTLPDERGIEDFVRLQIAFAHCLRMTLRRQPQTQVLGNYLDQEALQKVVASHSPANRILLLMGEWLAIRRRSGKLSDILFHSLNNRLNDMSSVLAGCERIANTPVPFAYTLILHRTVYLFCIMLPFALVVDLHYMTPFISVLISYTFIALDALAEELEDPFGTENNDLPLDAICNAIEIDLLQMNDERDIPAKRIPDKRYQLT
ncbi:DUF4186 family protein [Salmonella enterica subsp. enterica serovar Typhimurium]|nr:bestrophin family ion channel [Salmonella enterica]MBE5602592.1 DUF4186 family protein [Salmonella enterica subsp. enterica serovar Typhimurium]